MQLKSQVVSLELSKKLKKLGVKQKSLFYWCIACPTPHAFFHLSSEESMHSGIGSGRYISAFIVAELIKLLGDKLGVLERFKNGGWGCYIPNDCGVNGMGDTPQEALANLLINTYEESSEEN